MNVKENLNPITRYATQISQLIQEQGSMTVDKSKVNKVLSFPLPQHTTSETVQKCMNITNETKN